MPNRIDISIADAAFERMMEHAASFRTDIDSVLIAIDPKNRPAGQVMGEGMAWNYVQKAFEILTNERDLVTAKRLDYDAFKRDIVATTQLLRLRNALGGFVGRMNENFILLGKDLMEQANIVRQAVSELKDGSDHYTRLFNELNLFYEQRANQAAATQEHNAAMAQLQQRMAALVPPDGK